MYGLTSDPRRALSHAMGDGWGRRSSLAEREHAAGPAVGWVVAGVVVVGLGVLAWTYLGPDLKRYLKIHAM
jgi:hypothetical protein